MKFVFTYHSWADDGGVVIFECESKETFFKILNLRVHNHYMYEKLDVKYSKIYYSANITQKEREDKLQKIIKKRDKYKIFKLFNNNIFSINDMLNHTLKNELFNNPELAFSLIEKDYDFEIEELDTYINNNTVTEL